MAKKNEPQGYYNPETGEAVQIVKPKKKKTWLWLLIAAVVIIAIASGTGNKKSSPKTEADEKTNAAQTDGKTDAGQEAAQPEEDAGPDLSAVPTEYTLSAGYYTAGTDIPAGRFNLTAVSGTGNVSSSTNQFTEGGFSAIMGISDLEMYSETYNGAKLPEGAYIHVSGNLVLKMEYIRVDSAFTGRTADESDAFTLTPGQYVVGEDFPSGTYTLVADSGTGSVSSSEIFNGGINETVGISDLDMYIPRYENIAMKDGWDLKVSGLTIRLIPMR